MKRGYHTKASQMKLNQIKQWQQDYSNDLLSKLPPLKTKNNTENEITRLIMRNNGTVRDKLN